MTRVKFSVIRPMSDKFSVPRETIETAYGAIVAERKGPCGGETLNWGEGFLSGHATVGGSGVAAAVGVLASAGSAPRSAPALAVQSTQTLAFTGAGHLMLLVTMAMLLILAGLLLNGLARRHGGMVTLGPSRNGPSLRR